MDEKNTTRYAICKLKIVGGGEDDNMLSVETGCTDGNGEKSIATINTDNIQEVIPESGGVFK